MHFPPGRNCCYGGRLRDICWICAARLILWLLYVIPRDFIKRDGIWDPTIRPGFVLHPGPRGEEHG